MTNSNRDLLIGVVDVETAGLSPSRHTRVVEVAAVVITPDGQVVREFVSLVNPKGDVGPSHIHGIYAKDVKHAPTFPKILGHLIATLQGTTAIAGHNVRFDHEFLLNEFELSGQRFPPAPTLCTMMIGGRATLANSCARHGVTYDGNAHTALDDARAAARLLAHLLELQPYRLWNLSRMEPIEWPAVPVSRARPVTRVAPIGQTQGRSSFLSRLFVRPRR